MTDPFPAELEVIALLRDRTALQWDQRAVLQCVRDFPGVDHLGVAGACALYIQQHPNVRNGERTLRRFFQQAKDVHSTSDHLARRSHELSRYNRPRNQ